jgi:hypothetical protein
MGVKVALVVAVSAVNAVYVVISSVCSVDEGLDCSVEEWSRVCHCEPLSCHQQMWWTLEGSDGLERIQEAI